MNKTISIIMGIYNCADTLPDAIDSLLEQTYTDWELIMCDDGSSDNSFEVAEQYTKLYSDRIVLLRNVQNMGLNYTLNHCLRHASGVYIARMDGDDISAPERFEKEIQALEERPEIAVVSTNMTYFNEQGTWGKGNVIPFPTGKDFMHGTPFCHAPCMIRRTVMEEIGGYTDDPKYLRVEDYDLWVKLYAAGYRGMNLEEPLYHMRDDRNASKRRKFRYRINEARVICKAVRLLKLPVWNYIRACRPIVVGLLPVWLYQRLHKLRLGS